MSIILSEVLNNDKSLRTFSLITSLIPNKLYKEANPHHPSYYQVHKHNILPETDNKCIYKEYITWNKHDIPVLVSIVYDYDENEFIIASEFIQVYTKNPRLTNHYQFKEYVEHDVIYPMIEEYQFNYVNNKYEDWDIGYASIDIGAKEIHNEPITLFDYAIGIHNFNSPRANLMSSYDYFSEEMPQGNEFKVLDIPPKYRFLKKYEPQLPY